jgi:hypothetical protein
MELGEIPADGVYSDVGVLEAEALARNADPGDPGLGDVERSHTQRLPVHVHLCVLLHTENTSCFTVYGTVFWQCCGSGMFIPGPGSEFYPSRLPDPGSASKNLSI